MDHIYSPSNHQHYEIKECIDKLRNSVLSNNEMPQTFEEISQILNISEDDLKNKSLDICKIYEDYGKESSRNQNEEDDDKFSAFPEETLELNCMKFLRNGNVSFKEDRCKAGVRLTDKKDEITNNENSDIKTYEDSIITLRFYEPYKYFPCIKNHPRFQSEFQVLGSNLLTELKDVFYCCSNFGPFFDISEYPEILIMPNENTPKPGFFFIHDTFYNDTRNEANHDYSQIILKWSKKFHYMRDHKSTKMEETKFEDLKTRIGYPYVYQHHGSCEHVFCITSVDLIDDSDNLSRSHYPKLTRTSKKRTVLCEICSQREAAYIVTDCPLHVKDPIKLCENCFFSFHYIDRKKKTCDFKAYKLYNINPEGNLGISSADFEIVEEYEIENINYEEEEEENNDINIRAFVNESDTM